MLREMKINRSRVSQALEGGFMTATEIADYLVRQGIPFRTAHGIVGKLVRYCLDLGKPLSTLTLEDYQTISEKFDPTVLEIVAPQHAVNSKTSIGGTATQSVLNAIHQAKNQLGIGQ
jgi:argininosuccinate lyase